MFGIGTTELIVILAIALILLGPKRIPTIARSIGKALSEFKRAQNEFKYNLDKEIENEPNKESNEKNE
jgi:Tat protein translocase TatB subunit